ncbi:peptide chain release factor N(5)-glutamine methyltransferase [Prochlorococcus marinus]|uniref:peptide chain release factor N(5)-glutamine methyltransferase n=1 Tax=Prochlorococcus marinus TaxID=1219 RepID=UPI0022B33199|nr:peptide chain release factor N(5)-glutamine methyltransferase [Prochlorococcus marinus]
MILKGGSKVDFDWLLDIAAGVSWIKLQKIILNPEHFIFLEISTEELESIWESHLKDQTPLQYLISKCPWRDVELEASSEALIPRQETEFLIDFALKKVTHIDRGRWADLGTGSGPIAVSLAKSLPNWNGHASDICNEALDLAKRNLKSIVPNANVRFSLGDWWEPLKRWWGSFDLVLSNPPYIPSDLIAELEPVVKNHEPRIALDGGEDGMNASRKIILGASNGLAKGGWLILEHHYDQSEKIIDVMKNIGMEEVSFEKDLSGIKRYAICRKK